MWVSLMQIIHQYGRPVKARMLNGDVIERQDSLPYDGQVLPCLDYDNHFIYHTNYRVIGSTLMCTCGSPAGAFGYDAYKKYCSYIGFQVLGCISHLQTGRHGDGST